MRSVLVLASLLASAAAAATTAKTTANQLPDPIDKALVLDEDAFEDYLDSWLEQEQSRLPDPSPSTESGCTFQIRKDFGQPQPVYINTRDDSYLAANGNTGQIRLNSDDIIKIECTGSGKLKYPIAPGKKRKSISVAEVKCVNNNLVSGAGWLNSDVALGMLTCSGHSTPTVKKAKNGCWNNKKTLISMGFDGRRRRHLYFSCFDEERMEALYVSYAQTPEHAVHQTGVKRPFSWQAGNFYPGVNPEKIYNQDEQKKALAKYVGDNLANRYITETKQHFFSRGHLAAKSDFVFAYAQRATFYYFNAAPQWQCINAGNWNTLEQELRARIAAQGYHTMIYTGTYGVMQLRDKDNELFDIYLAQGKIPVPLVFYKVVHDRKNSKGTAFITINNPHITKAEAQATARQFCDCHCRDNEKFDWLNWDPDNTDVGYSFCCTVDELKKKIPYLPNMDVNGLLS